PPPPRGGRPSRRSRNRRNHPRLLKATSAPATKPRPSPPGRPWRVVLDAHAANWPVFTPPLTIQLGALESCAVAAHDGVALHQLLADGFRKLGANVLGLVRSN